MRTGLIHWSKLVAVILGILVPIANAMAMANAALAYETIVPARIKLGDSAVIRVTSLDGYLKNIELPDVAGLTFELMGRTQGIEVVNGSMIPSNYILIRVTPQFTGTFSIPGVTPNSHPIGLEVVNGNEPNPYVLHTPRQFPAPLPVLPAPIPKGLELKAGGSAFVQLTMPTREVYVGESVPVDIEVGVRPGVVMSLKGLPALSGSDFTLNNLSKQPERREQDIQGSSFVVMTWHSVIAAVKPGEFSLSAETPLSVKVNTFSAVDSALAARMAFPFLQNMYNGIVPKDVTVASPPSKLKVLPLPTQGQPDDFSGAVGDFRISSDASPAGVAAGDPLTLSLHVTGAGNFDRVDSTMLDHLDHWKTYPAKSSFTPSDAAGYKGEKVFEQPLIAAQSGEQTIPGLDFSFFNPNTRTYERVHTEPIKITVAASLADRSPSGLSGASMNQLAQSLRPDHQRLRTSMVGMRPLYFQTAFMTVPAIVALILAAGWFGVRPSSMRGTSKSAERTLAQLNAAALSHDPALFFALARTELLKTFAARWQMTPEQINAATLRTQLGEASGDVERLWSLADEVKYSRYDPASTDFTHWLELIRGQLKGEIG
jgi:hypothetical protein